MALKIIKITKGYGRRIGSTFAYQTFWDFLPTILEAEIELDLDTNEGKEELKKVNAQLFKTVKALTNIDIKNTEEKDEGLRKTLIKIQERVEKDENK